MHIICHRTYGNKICVDLYQTYPASLCNFLMHKFVFNNFKKFTKHLFLKLHAIIFRAFDLSKLDAKLS